jgi:hypothetical protein
MAHDGRTPSVRVVSTVRHLPPVVALDRAFSQVIDGLGERGGGRDRAPENAVHLTTVNCLTLMLVVIVKFLTVTNGHVGLLRIPSA